MEDGELLLEVNTMMTMMSRKIITFYSPELSARGAKQDARLALPAIGRLWPSGNDDYDDGICDYDEVGRD